MLDFEGWTREEIEGASRVIAELAGLFSRPVDASALGEEHALALVWAHHQTRELIWDYVDRLHAAHPDNPRRRPIA